MNNEITEGKSAEQPVAWIPKDHLKEMGKAGFRHTGVSYQEDKFYNIPLYTHPAKTLTDAEIKKARVEALQEYYNNNHDYEFELSLIDELFARAILRKAQEK